jgi:hypothetical protein
MKSLGKSPQRWITGGEFWDGWKVVAVDHWYAGTSTAVTPATSCRAYTRCRSAGATLRPSLLIAKRIRRTCGTSSINGSARHGRSFNARRLGSKSLERLIDRSIRRGVCPKWASIVTIGVDRQQDNRFPWVAIAWGPGRRAAVVAYGEADSLEKIGSDVFRPWPHEDGGIGIAALLGAG